MAIASGWTTRDLDALPDRDDWRYEIIDGELLVSKTPHSFHQAVYIEVAFELEVWNRDSQLGVVLGTPGLVFAEDQNVIPDVAWASHQLFATALDGAGHLTQAPEVVIEVLSPGAANHRRDRDLKVSLYARRGVQEYWIVDWVTRSVQVYRHDGTQLRLVATLFESEVLTSEVLPGFHCPIERFWTSLPPAETISLETQP